MARISKQVDAYDKILKRLDKGTITTEELENRCKVHALIHKEEKLALEVVALSIMHGVTPKKLFSAGLVSKNEIIRTEIPELSQEWIDCPDMDKTITRSECLDYSGETEHFKDCQSCPNFNLTRNLLMPVN